MKTDIHSLTLVAALGLPLALPTPAFAELKGDAAGLQLVEEMLEHLGGRDQWASARTLRVVEHSRHPNAVGGIVGTFYRDLQEPFEWAHLENPNLDIVYSWDSAAGWQSRNGEVRDLDKEEHDQRLQDWGREIYVLYHQLAQGKRDLTISSLVTRGFAVANEEGEKIGEFHLTAEGDLYRWQQFGDDPVEYVYGPHKDFGPVSFPDWGTSTDGMWSFYYREVEILDKPGRSLVDPLKPTGRG